MKHRIQLTKVVTIALVGLLGLTQLGCSGDEEGHGHDCGAWSRTSIHMPRQTMSLYSLLDHENEYVSEPTGADGRFFLEVPLGSPNLLVTNDWAGLGQRTLRWVRPSRTTGSPSSTSIPWFRFWTGIWNSSFMIVRLREARRLGLGGLDSNRSAQMAWGRRQSG